MSRISVLGFGLVVSVLPTAVARAGFTSIDVGAGINGVYLQCEAQDFLGGNASNTALAPGGTVADFPLSISGDALTATGVRGYGEGVANVALVSPTQVTTTAQFLGTADTHGVQGSAWGGAGGIVFLRFTLDAAAQVQMDWMLDDSFFNVDSHLGRLRMYESDLNGNVFFDAAADGTGLPMSGLETFNLDAGSYLLLAESSVKLFAELGDGESFGTAGWDVTFNIVPAPSALALFGLGALGLHRRR